MQRWNCDVKLTTSSQRRYYDVATALYQLCEQRQRWIIHGFMVAFLQLCLKFVKRIKNDTSCAWYVGSTFWHQIQAIVFLSYSKVQWFRKMSSDKLESYSLNLSKRNCPALDFLSNLKTTIFLKIARKISS